MALVAMVSFPVATARAQRPASPASDERKAEARSHFELGLAHFDREEWPAALVEFLRSRELFATRNNTKNAAIPPIFHASDRGIYPIDSVLAVVEVKSKLTALDYEGIAKAAAKLDCRVDSSLRIVTPGTIQVEVGGETQYHAKYPVFSVFAFEADAERDEVERLKERAAGREDSVHLIGVLGKGVWLGIPGKPHEKISVANKEDIGVQFLALLLENLVETANSRGTFRLRPWLEQEASR